MSEVQSAKVGKLSERAGNPVFSPSRLLAAVCKVAPQFKVRAGLHPEANVRLPRRFVCAPAPAPSGCPHLTKQ